MRASSTISRRWPRARLQTLIDEALKATLKQADLEATMKKVIPEELKGGRPLSVTHCGQTR
jgi:hypothetical protein